jgi:hypothetical protein
MLNVYKWFKTRVRRGSCPRTAPLGARAEKRLSRETALRANPGPPARVLCALGWKRDPFAVTRYRVLKPPVVTGGSRLAAGSWRPFRRGYFDSRLFRLAAGGWRTALARLPRVNWKLETGS